jgi:hypothetical protein
MNYKHTLPKPAEVFCKPSARNPYFITENANQLINQQLHIFYEVKKRYIE